MLKNQLFMFVKNTRSFLCKYFENSDVIVVRKEKFIESLLAFAIFMF